MNFDTFLFTLQAPCVLRMTCGLNLNVRGAEEINWKEELQFVVR